MLLLCKSGRESARRTLPDVTLCQDIKRCARTLVSRPQRKEQPVVTSQCQQLSWKQRIMRGRPAGGAGSFPGETASMDAIMGVVREFVTRGSVRSGAGTKRGVRLGANL